MKHTIVFAALAALATLACGAAPPASTTLAAEAPAPSESDFDATLSENLPPKFFSSKTGLEVEVVYLKEGPDGAGRALCRIRGIPHPLAGKVVFISGEVKNSEFEWKLRFNADDHLLLWTHRMRSGQDDQAQVHMKLPRDLGNQQLEYSAVRSQQIDTNEVIAIHKRQLADGTLAKLEQVDRDYHIKRLESLLRSDRKHVKKSCGAEIPFAIDWESVFGFDRQTSNGCTNTFRAVAKACQRNDASRRLINKRVKKIECGYGESSTITESDAGLLRIQIGRDRTNYNPIYGELKKYLKLTRTVAESDSGRFIIVEPDDMTQAMYLGDGKVMHRLVQTDKGSEVWSTNSRSSYVRRVPEGVRVTCTNTRAVLYKPVSDARRQEILDNARFEDPLWQREAYGLARDDRGIYYYVDHLQEEFGGKDFKVYIGARGQLKLSTLLDVVDDSHGTIFATKSGKLRLILSVGRSEDRKLLESSWIAKKKAKKLVVLPIDSNKDLIYKELGVYDAEYFGTPCEK